MYAMKSNVKTTMMEADRVVREELAKQGFGILTEIDVQATLKKKLDVDRMPYIILGACNPPFANRAIQAEPDIGVLLPCNVVIREEDDHSVTIAYMDPGAAMSIIDNPEIQKVAGEVKEKLTAVQQAVENTLTP